MSNSVINIRPTFRDSNGLPRASGLLYFYVNKTTTLASIFSDEDLSVAQSNPYTLDAFGRTAGDIKYTGKLTVKATNADGSDPTSDDDVITGAGDISITEQFQTTESDPQAMTVLIKAGKVMNGETLVTIANQTTTVITAPSGNPRIDRIVINKLTGVFTIITGSESATPTAPAITAGNAPSSQILLATTTTVITDALITDERISGSVEPSNVNTTETLTNKSINLSNNTVTGSTANFNTALSDGSFATLAGTETLTNKSINLANNTLTTTVAQLNTAISDDSICTLGDAETITGVKTFNEDIVMQAANGIDMSANTGAAGETSSVLVWYEEGTWTPVLWDNSLADESATYTVRNAKYTRIGRIIHINAYIVISGFGTLTTGQAAKIGGLPFTSDNTSGLFSVVTVGNTASLAITAGVATGGTIVDSASHVSLTRHSATTGTEDLLISEITSNGTITISGSYLA